MEFRSCPACKASVLEEDVDECPFCGASMSGKPGAGAAKKPSPAKAPAGKPQAKSTPATPAVSPAKPGSPRPPGKPVATAKESSAQGDPEDPFEVDTSALRRAVKLAPRPTKTRTMEVSCPMCETPGFMLPADAGKDVHCCNPECMVPVFKTVRPKVEEVRTEEPRDMRWIYLGGGVGTAVIAGVAFWFFVLVPKKLEEIEAPDEPVVTTPIEDLNLTPDNKIVRPVDAPPATLGEIRTKSLAAMLERVRQKDRNRSPEYGTQLAAEAFAEAGDLTKAREQVRRLQSIAAQAPYLQVQPLVEIGWQELAAGRLKEAQQTATAALAKAKNSPHSIRKTLDAASSLAALLVAVKLDSEAQELIQREQDFGIRDELSTLWRAAIDGKTFQIDLEASRPWHLSMPEPMRIAVVESLVSHGQDDAALAVAGTGTDLASVGACRAAWAGRITTRDPQQAVARVAAALQAGKAAPAAQCQAWAAVAAVAQTQKLSDVAVAATTELEAAAAKLQPTNPAPLPSLQGIHDSEGKPFVGLPNPAPARAAALAHASRAVVQLQAGQPQEAWSSFQQALAALQAMAPSSVVTQQLLDECEKQESSVRNRLNAALNLGGNEQNLRTAFSRYRRQCGKLHAEAERSLQLQVALLRYAAEQGLLSEVWSYARDRATTGEPAQRQPYLETTLPGLVQSLAQAQGKADLVNSVAAAFSEKAITVDPLDPILAEANVALAAGNLTKASDALERAYRSPIAKKDPYHTDLIALRCCARAQSATSPAAMIPFIKNLADVVVEEDAFLQLAGYTTLAGTAPGFWKEAAASRELEALDFVSIYRGFVEAIPASPPAAAAQADTAAANAR